MKGKRKYKAPEFIGFRTSVKDRENLLIIQEELGIINSSELIRNALNDKARAIQEKRKEKAA